MTDLQPRERLLTRDFASLNVIMFLAFCNMAVMFRIFDYLKTLPLDPRWHGILISLFPLTALVLRPLISPLFHAGNARKWTMVFTVAVMATLWAYLPARSLWPMVLVRILHGGAYVGLATAAMTLAVCYIPAARSGQAFGLLSVSTVLPYVLIPPLLEPAEQWLGGFQWVLALTSPVIMLALPLLLFLRPPGGADGSGLPAQTPIKLSELAQDLKDRRVTLLLLLALLFYCTFSTTFFFINSYGRSIGITNPGLFFTITASATIATRLLAGSVFDKLNKRGLLAGSLLLLAAGYVALARCPGQPWIFYGLGLVFGLAWGVAMPLMNALMYEISPPRFRGLNVNLAVEMIDGGFFLGPLIGGSILVAGDYTLLYDLCGVIVLGALALVPLVSKRKEKQIEEPTARNRH
jgi:predicted MFS family arabinose efflux permease